MGDRQLVLNKVRCKACGEELISFHRHDYKTCSCPQQTMVDGGTSYARWGGMNMHDIEHLHLYTDDPFEQTRLAPVWGSYGKNGDQPLKRLSVAEMTDNHIDVLIADYGGKIPEWLLDHFLKETVYRKNNNIKIKEED